MTPAPKYAAGAVVVLNRGVPKRRPGEKGRAVVWLEAGHQFAVVRVRDAGGGFFDYDLRDTQGAVWTGVGEIALDPAEGAAADAPAPDPPRETLFD